MTGSSKERREDVGCAAEWWWSGEAQGSDLAASRSSRDRKTRLSRQVEHKVEGQRRGRERAVPVPHEISYT